MDKKKLVFLTGTRADFGKLKSLITEVDNSDSFDCYVFITGMHTLSKYGDTYVEVERAGYKKIYKFINQRDFDDMDTILSNTIIGFANYVKETKPDMIIVHGDRIEALAGALVGSLNNIRVLHIEGGEISGTIDELIRHAITKLSHVHFVSNEEAKKRLVSMGEKESNIFVIGSFDLDAMSDENMPPLEKTKKHYDIDFDKYALFIYHPVTTINRDKQKGNIDEVISAVTESGRNYLVVYPNNDPGSDIIMDGIMSLKGNKHFRLFTSLRYEYFLTLLKNSEFIIGNSSSGIKEASIFGIPTIDIGSRQKNRSKNENIINVPNDKGEILKAISKAGDMEIKECYEFVKGDSTKKFYEVLKRKDVWDIPHQKQFVDS